MTQYERRYVELIRRILETGEGRDGRNGPTIALFAEKLEVNCNLMHELPLLNGRKMYPKGILGEFAAFIRGPKHVSDFERWGCNYWKQWAKEDGTIELDYGNSWFDFNGTDQVRDLVSSLQNDPHGRRHLISGWRPDRLAEVDLPCCHMLYQWYVTNEGKLDMIWYQRSVDVMVGLPSDVLLAAIFNICLAEEVDLIPGKLTFMLGDCHIYGVHKEGVIKYLDQVEGASDKYAEYNWTSNYKYAELLTGNLPFEPSMIQLSNYNPQPSIAFEVVA